MFVVNLDFGFATSLSPDPVFGTLSPSSWYWLIILWLLNVILNHTLAYVSVPLPGWFDSVYSSHSTNYVLIDLLMIDCYSLFEMKCTVFILWWQWVTTMMPQSVDLCGQRILLRIVAEHVAYHLACHFARTAFMLVITRGMTSTCSAVVPVVRVTVEIQLWWTLLGKSLHSVYMKVFKVFKCIIALHSAEICDFAT